MPYTRLTRRGFLAGALAGASGRIVARADQPAALPSVPVAIARCRRYEFDAIRTRLASMFDQIGGIQALVNGKTITVKVNLTGGQQTNVYTGKNWDPRMPDPLDPRRACFRFMEIETGLQ